MSFYFYDLSGGLNLTQSKTTLGLATKKITSSEAVNVELHQNKGIIRQNGNILLYDLHENADITGLFELERDGSRYLLICTSNGKLYMSNYQTGVLTCLKSDFTGSENVSFVKFLGGVCVSNGIDEPVFVDVLDVLDPVKPMNTTTSDDVQIKGLAMCAYNGRLWIADGSTLYYSALGRYDDWQSANDAGYISNFHSDYSKITALCTYREFLAIYKNNQIYFLSGFSENDFKVQPFANVGTDAQNAVLTVNNKQYLFSKGVYNLAQVGELGQIILSSDIANPIKPYIESYDKDRANKICVVPYEEKNQIWFFIPRKNAAYIDEVWIYDYLNNAWFTRKIPQNITCAGKLNGKPITGDKNGKIYIEDMSNSFCGVPIEFSWKTPYFSFNSPSRRKVIDRFEFLLNDAYDNDFAIYIQKNYEDGRELDLQEIKTYNPLNLLWDDDFTCWADEETGFCWARAVDCKERALISDKNLSVQICVKGNEITHNCCILGLEFDEFDYY